MNYIKKMQADAAEQNARIDSAISEINDFIAHLHSEKFAGHDSRGERKDWIATSDVLNRLIELRSNLQGVN